MSGRGLLARLSAREDADRARDVHASVLAHLRVLLNSRLGQAAIAPDFGVVDLSELLQSHSLAAQSLQRSIRATILKYERRLIRVRVRHIRSDDPFVLSFDISGQLQARHGQRSVRFHTRVVPGGELRVW